MCGHTLSLRMIIAIKRNMGMTVGEIRRLPHDEIDRRIEKRIGHPLSPVLGNWEEGDDSVLL